MIYSVKKIPTLRYVLIILVFSALSVSAIYLYLHNQKAEKLQGNIENVISARENSALVDSCILNLYNADNSSRMYSVTGNKMYLRDFANDLYKISFVINRIKYKGKQPSDLDSAKFGALMREKSAKTDVYMRLRLLTDSLIRYSAGINKALNHYDGISAKPIVSVRHVVTTDTIKAPAVAQPQKKLLGRLISAFSRKKQPDTAARTVVVRDTTTTTSILSKADPATKKIAYKTYYKKLDDVNDKLRKNEQQILVINNNLIQEIITSLQLYKAVEQLYMQKSKTELTGNMADVFSAFKETSIISFLFLLALVVVVFYNIWKIFRNDQEIIVYSEKAAQYADSKSRFLAGMSHEIRTPLNSVIGFSEQLSQESLTPTQKEQVGAIRSSSEMLLELVNEILDFSKYETGKMSFESSPFRVGQVLQDVFNSMYINAQKKNIQLKNDIAVEHSLYCEGDKMRLQQVVMNLMGNAIKFTLKGSVTLSAFVEHVDEQNVLLKVGVIDTGLGIDKNDLPHIFDEFSQVATAQKATRQKGTGLGLAICKKIVELQGGKINVSSVTGQGSTFSFELPLKLCDQVEQAATQTISDDMMAKLVDGKTVLFADDDKFNVLLGKTILKKWNINFDIAYNGREALDLFERNNYDLILTDIQMPELNGLELTEQVRNNPNPVKAKTTIMALTANVMKEDRDVYFKTGVNDVILKPFHEKTLIEKIALSVRR